ncbi:sugar ABC transporter permease, partial [Elstera litoralis]
MKPKRSRLSTGAGAISALIPAFMVLIVVYIGSTGWTIWISFTNSRMLPNNNFVGLRQYEQLFGNDRWLTSIHNLVIFGALFLILALALGFLLAVAIDQRVR